METSLKKHAPVISKFVGSLLDAEHWEVSMCGKHLTLFRRNSYTWRPKGAMKTVTNPVIYVLAPTGCAYEDNKHMVLDTHRGDPFQHHRIGAIWMLYEAVFKRMPTQEEVDLF